MFQKQVQKDLSALDRAAYISLTGVPSKEQLPSEKGPAGRQKESNKPKNQLHEN